MGPHVRRNAEGRRRTPGELREENQPVGVNEEILVYKMAVSLWNFSRAGLLIADAMENAVNDDEPNPSLALALRYQTSADRQFNQNLRELRKLQKERRLEEIGFVSQEPEQAALEEARKPETPPAAPPQSQPAAPKPPAPAALVAETLEIEVAKAPDKAA
jgi:hypothetical protein